MFNPYHLLFEFSIYCLFGACLVHAARQGRYRVLELVFAGVYGFLLEWLTIRQLASYHYGYFLIMLDGAPLSVALAWAAIIYSSMEFSSRIKMPDAARPLVDGLLALNIDLALDAVAIRLGMWSWAVLTLDKQWFGVPWGNFWAWFIVVASYSFFLRALRSWGKQSKRGWLYVPLTLLLSLAVVLVTNQLFVSVINKIGDGLIGPVLLIVGSLLIILAVHPRVQRVASPDLVVIGVPLVFHVLTIGAGIIYGFFSQLPALAVVALVMLVLGILIHLWPWFGVRPTISAQGSKSD
ncbi:MAG: carotenoid biosynthesis protein [Aggregatilineales bacterium]